MNHFSTPKIIMKEAFHGYELVANHFYNKFYSLVISHNVGRASSFSLWTLCLSSWAIYQAQLNMALATMLIIPAASETSIHHWCDILCVQISSWRLMLKTAHAFTLLHCHSPTSSPHLKGYGSHYRHQLLPSLPTCFPACLWPPWMPASSSNLWAWRSGDYVYLWL